MKTRPALARLCMAVGVMTAACAHVEQTVPPRPIEKVLADQTPVWMKIPGVVGTAVGESRGRPALQVYVDHPTPELRRQIPANVEGYEVVIIESGSFKPVE